MTEQPHVPEPWQDRFDEARRALERRWALTKLTGKVPVFKGWQRRKPDDLKTIQKWLRSGANLGLRTGTISGIVVIDDDSEDGSAGEALNLPVTVTVLTGSGRRHYYFTAPADLRVGNSVKTLADGIDVRGDGGQVVFVGSVHPDTGKTYEWAPGRSPDDVAIAELPAHIIERLRNRKKTKENPKPQLTLLAPDEGLQAAEASDARVEAYVRAALDGEEDRVYSSTEGTRNASLNQAAFALGQLVGAGVLDRELVSSSLRRAAVAVGLDDAEIDATLRSGLEAGEKEPRDIADLEAQANAASSTAETAKDTRPKVVLYGGWLHRAVSKAEGILLRQSPPMVYQRGNVLVRVISVPDPGPGLSKRRRPAICELTAPALIDRLTQLICWQKFDRKTEAYYTVDCPDRVALILLSRSGAWRVPALAGVIDRPTLLADGSVLDTEGFDRRSGLYLCSGGQCFPPIPLNPTDQQVQQAKELLLEILKDFPFLEECDRSVAVSAILTSLIRPSLRTAPLFAFRAAKMGSGKSLLADVVAMIATGRPAAMMSQGADENEDKKRMLPILAEGEPVAVIDNIERPFGSAALCSILTQPTWRDRVLGKSQTMTLPTTNTTWLATGNNIQFDGDITTRTLVCDLDPRCERPEEREFNVNLHKHIPAHREQLVTAGLTLLRAYHVAGRPDMQLRVFGRFEEWSDWVRSAVVWLGLPDPCATRRRVEETDSIRSQLAQLLAALKARFGTAKFAVADVLASLQSERSLNEVITPILATANQGQAPGQCLGLYFQRIDRRPEGGIRLLRDNTASGVANWRIEDV